MEGTALGSCVRVCEIHSFFRTAFHDLNTNSIFGVWHNPQSSADQGRQCLPPFDMAVDALNQYLQNCSPKAFAVIGLLITGVTLLIVVRDAATSAQNTHRPQS